MLKKPKSLEYWCLGCLYDRLYFYFYFTVYFVFDIVKKNWLDVFKVIQTLFFSAKESTSFPLETTTIRKLKEKFEQTGSVCDIQQRP